MRLIAHRGNINGPDPLNENNPDYIETAIECGYDVEIDVRYDTFDGQFYLGHDNPQYLVTWYWLASKKDKLWIHCKNVEALHKFTSETGGFNFFWHQEDDYTLTSKNYIWTYPGKPYAGKSIVVMPEKNSTNFDQFRIINCYGICSDYVGKFK